MPKLILLTVFVFFVSGVFAQETKFTRADTLRGSLRPERTCFDVKFYDLTIEVFPKEKKVTGQTAVFFKAVEPTKRIQLDLFQNMNIEKIVARGKKLNFKREFDAFFADLPIQLSENDTMTVFVHFSGNPRVAVNPPWDGGFSWSKDKLGRDWIAVSCEGLGASVWWANKDHLSDEPDSMRITCTVPDNLVCVANGNLRNEKKLKGKKTYEWFVSYPINNYNVTLNIAHYAQFSDEYISPDFGKLALDYYVLDYNLNKAKRHFEQVKPMLACYEKYFGQYPFWNDGFALVETPYWGMEHQSAIAYGNNYQNIPFYNFDYIIIHESGHEYFGNSISVKDHADMWIHESFTTYAEAIYVEEFQGKDAAVRYLKGQRMLIRNVTPIQGIRNVNFDAWVGSDMYYKGSWMLHTLRHIVDNDSLWFDTVKNFCKVFYHKNTDTEEVTAFFEKSLGLDLTAFFDVYLRQKSPPVLAYSVEKKEDGNYLQARFENVPHGFSLPITFSDEKGNKIRLNVTKDYQNEKLPSDFGRAVPNSDLHYFLLK
jgi:aminopeptidase N